jgi:cation diffusion facilitator CzcD-associated flavoprotein CzcO
MEINPNITFRHDRKVMHARRPKVLIVGAGLGGLTLGAILQKTDIPYEIFERAPLVKPLGRWSKVPFTQASSPSQYSVPPPPLLFIVRGKHPILH